jgi:hypothetical protein
MRACARWFYVFIFILALLFPASAFSAEFKCEVLSVKGLVIATSSESGDRSLKEGDLLSLGDEITVGDDSYVDLAYDKERLNVTRLESNTHIRLESVAPGRLHLENGAVFAKLKKLPHNSEFQVQTPTAVASVRGTEYLTRHVKGHTEVLNASASPIFVYGVKSDGSVDKDSEVVLERSKKTVIEKAGEAPSPPAVMTDEEKAVGNSLTSQIQKNVEVAESEGRTSALQTVDEIEAYIEKTKEESANRITAPANESDLSRVTDTRRRAFGGQKTLAPPQQEPAKEESPPDQNT